MKDLSFKKVKYVLHFHTSKNYIFPLNIKNITFFQSMKLIMKRFLLLALLFISLHSVAQQNRWALDDTNSITWKTQDRLPHLDHIEMSGKFISVVVHYGVNADQSFNINRDVVWPMLRTIPNNTHASLIRSFNLDVIKMIAVNRKQVQQEKVNEITLNGKLNIKSTIDGSLELVRTIFPSIDLPVLCEKYELINKGRKSVTVEIPQLNIQTATNAEDGTEGSYQLKVHTKNSGTFELQPNQSSILQ
jgi:hypothetical protein